MSYMIENFRAEDDLLQTKLERPISATHIRVQQRNGKKCITLIEGLASDLDLKKIAKALRKTFKTSATVLNSKESEEEDEVIMVGGDFRNQVKEFLLKFHVIENPDPEPIVHGC